MRYWVVGAIALALLCNWMGTAASPDPQTGSNITLPWWTVPLSPLIIFSLLVIRRLLR